MKRVFVTPMLLLLSNHAAATGVFDHFLALSNANDFGVCNTMLVLHDVTDDERPEIFLSHFEYRTGGVHIWNVYTPRADGTARYLGNVEFHPRGLRVYPAEPGFLTYAGEHYGKWHIDAKGLHADAQVTLDETLAETVPYWAQRCTDQGETIWAGANDATLTDVDLGAEVVSGADALAEASRAGDISRMNEMLATWVDMYAADNAGGAALLSAATSGRTDSLQLLFGRSDSHPEPVLRQAIQAAAWNGHASAVQMILEQDLGDGRMALVQEALGFASQGGRSDVVTLLLAAGADANAATSAWQPKSPLELAAQFQHDNIIAIFRSSGADVRSAGVVALFDAIDKGDETSVRQLVIDGVSTESERPGDYPTPALVWSIVVRQPTIALALLELGADVDVSTPHKDTPLIEAAQYGYLEIVSALLDRRADVGATNHIRVDALTSAAAAGNVEIVRTLLDRARNDLPEDALNRGLVSAARSGHSSVVCTLLTAGADLDWENELQRTAAVTATMARKPEMVELLGNWEAACQVLPEANSSKP